MQKSRSARVLIAILLALAMALATATPMAGAVDPTGGISGTVVDESGTGTTNVKVYYQQWDGSGWPIGWSRTITDSNGNYAFLSDDGQYRVRFRDWAATDPLAYEYFDDAAHQSDSTTVTVSGGVVTTSINATLAPGSTISGKIKNERGEPIEGVSVSAQYLDDPAAGSWGNWVAATTDANGDYTLKGLPADSFALRFTSSSPYKSPEFYDNVYLGGDATWIPLGKDEDLTGYDAVLEYTDEEGPTVSSDIKATYVGSASIEITATDVATGDSGIYKTYYNLDSAGWVGTPGATATCDTDQLGDHTITYKAKDEAWNYSDYITKQFTITRDEAAASDEVAGDNRYATAIAASQSGFPGGASAVVIATGTNWPDALGGAALAGVIDGPLLLTTPSALPDSVKDEISNLGATEAYIVGGTGAVSQAVEDSLGELLGAENVNRLFGATRYQTADAVAAEVISQLGGRYDGNAFCATGGNFPDALAASSIAAAKGWPMLLTPYGGNPTLPAQVTDVTILGGTGAVAESTEAWLEGELGDTHVDRLGGANRYETGAMVAQFGIEEGLFWDGVGLAVGSGFPDALSGGAMLGSQGTVLLLTPGSSLSAYAETLLGDNKQFIENVQFLGGTGAVSQTVRGQAMDAVQ